MHLQPLWTQLQLSAYLLCTYILTIHGQTLEATSLPYSHVHRAAPPTQVTQATHQVAAPFISNQLLVVELPDSSSHLSNCIKLPSSSNSGLRMPPTVRQGTPDQAQDNAARVDNTSDRFFSSLLPAANMNGTQRCYLPSAMLK